MGSQDSQHENGGTKTFVEQLEDDYRDALMAIDEDAKKLVESGKEMKAVMLILGSLGKIASIHETLDTFYSAIYKHKNALSRFNSETKAAWWRAHPSLQHSVRIVGSSRRSFCSITKIACAWNRE